MSGYQPESLTDDAAQARTSSAWRVTDGVLGATYRSGSMVRGLAMVTEVVAAAEEANHHPDIDLRYPSVTYRLVTHSAGGLTTYDVALAARIDEIAAELGIDSSPAEG